MYRRRTATLSCARAIVALAHRHRRIRVCDDLSEAAAKRVRSSTTSAWIGSIERRACRSSAGGGSRYRRRIVSRSSAPRPPTMLGPWTSCSTAVANGRSLKILGIVDDGTHESVAKCIRNTLIGGDHLVRILGASVRHVAIRGSSAATTRRNSPVGRCSPGHTSIRSETYDLSNPVKPNQNALRLTSFNGRLAPSECLNEHWFLQYLAHARSTIDTWLTGIQRGTTEERAWRPHAISIREDAGNEVGYR